MKHFQRSFLTLLALVCVLSLQSGCYRDTNDHSPSPSNSFALSQAELDQHLTKAKNGDVSSMNRLVDYYWFNQENASEQGLYWLEQAAEAGDLQARKSVLEYYEGKADPKLKAHADVRRKKWNAQASRPE